MTAFHLARMAPLKNPHNRFTRESFCGNRAMIMVAIIIRIGTTCELDGCDLERKEGERSRKGKDGEEDVEEGWELVEDEHAKIIWKGNEIIVKKSRKKVWKGTNSTVLAIEDNNEPTPNSQLLSS